MALYDPNAWKKSWNSYLAQKALTTGTPVNPAVMGELGLAELTARYNSEKENKQIANQTRMTDASIANMNAQQALANKQLSAQKSSAGVSNLGSIASLALSGIGLANKMGLIGNNETSQDRLNDALIQRLLTGGTGATTSTVQNTMNTGDAGDTDWNFYSPNDNSDWSMFSNIPTPTDSVGPLASGYVLPEEEWDWMSMFNGWF